MLIYNVGSASIADPETSQQLKALTKLAPDVPLMIVSDSECRGRDHIGVEIGAQGFLYAGTNITLALQAFSSCSKTDHMIRQRCGQNRLIQSRLHGRSTAIPYPFALWAGAMAP